jgi:hypothetical protein
VHLLSIRVRSRSGNIILACLGVMYAGTALVLFARVLDDAWLAIGKREMAMLLMLAGAVICGAWFLLISLNNLRILERTGMRGLPHFRRRHSGVVAGASVQ